MCDARGGASPTRGFDFNADGWNVTRRDVCAHGRMRNAFVLLKHPTLEGLVQARTGTWQLRFMSKPGIEKPERESRAVRVHPPWCAGMLEMYCRYRNVTNMPGTGTPECPKCWTVSEKR